MGLADFLPLLAMLAVQSGYAGMNTTSKLAMNSGMKPLVIVAYRQAFATLAMLPLAYFIEGKPKIKITMSLLFQIFICSLTGITGNQALFIIGLERSTLTVATALTNILPAVTFVLAVLFRQESVGLKKKSGLAKVLGTVVCVGGAMLLTFYHGHNIDIGKSKIHLKYADDKTGNSNDDNKSILGPFLVIASTFSWAVWYIVQVKVSKKFPAPYTSTFLMCLMGSIQCGVIGISANHKLSEWSLRSPLRLIAVLYAGIVCTAFAFSLSTWTIQRKGALYVSIFSPLLLIISAILGWALLREKIYVGTILGSVLIVVGLYAVLWGKDKEEKKNIQEQEPTMAGDHIDRQAELKNTEEKESAEPGEKEERDDLEMQLPGNSVGNVNQCSSP